jgi:acyl-CoA synthetase (NDP forming)
MEEAIQKLDAFFNPRSVAVIGATKKEGKAGAVIFKNFATNKLRGVFKGELYPINPKEADILGFKCYETLSKVPGDVDLIVVIVPSVAVPGVLEEAGGKNVKAAVIISAGFKEVGNHALEDQVVAVAKKYGIRVLGPNCLGVFYAKTGVDSLFLPEIKTLSTGKEVVATPRPMSGNIAMITQSGAFGSAALDYLTGRQMGVSKFVSFGNKCDTSESDILEYLLYDKETDVVLLYLEDVKSGKDFLKVAKKVSLKKPIVVIKSGKSEAGARAAASHTGAIAGADKIYDAAFEKTGVIRAKNMNEFFDIGKALAMMKPCLGSNIGILTDAGGPGVMCVDECEIVGLTVNKFSEPTLKKFEALKENGSILKISATHNPVDLTGSVVDDQFVAAADLMFQEPTISGIIFLGLHHMPGLQEKYIAGVAEVAAKYNKPIVACDIGETEMALYTRSRFDRLGIPAYSSPEDAAHAMKALLVYGSFLQKNGALDAYIAEYNKRKAETKQ